MSDLTVFYYTSNKIREPFGERVREILLKAIGNLPLVSVSQKPMSFGRNICIGEIGKSFLNIYRQILAGAKEVQTEYVAFAEDDVLYPTEHFTVFRPPQGSIAYDVSKWSIYTWSRPPMYSFKNRVRTNTSCLAPTKLIVEALEERFAKFPDAKEPPKYWAEIGKFDRYLGVKEWPVVEYTCDVPHVVFSHEDAVGFEYIGKRKRPGFLKAYDIPYWGKAEDIMKLWKED